MKTVVALHASRRKLNTYGLLAQIRQLLALEDAQVEILPIYDLHIKDCVGCEQCIRQGSCVLQDDMAAIMAKLEAADGIILSSPVYMRQVSGKLKTLFDRTCVWFHRPTLYGKPVLCVATTKGSGLKGTLAYLRSVAEQWGAIPAGSVGRSLRTLRNPVTPREVSDFAKLLQAPEGYRPPLASLMNFEVQKALATHLGGLDAIYWTRMGWDAKPYYIPCRTGWFKRLLSVGFGLFLQRRMAKGNAGQGTDPRE